MRSEVAATEVEKRFSELERTSSPVMLFLRRMSALSLIRRGGKRPDSKVALSREAQPLVVKGDKTITAEIVTIDERQRFLVVSRDVDPAELRATLRQSVDATLLNSKWLGWETLAHVAVAVSLDEPAKNGRLYTYLPMGSESTAPFPGHVHAPFYTDFARRGLVRDHPLNAMLFDAVAVAMDELFDGLVDGVVEDLAGQLVDEVNDYLTDHGVPEVRPPDPENGDDGRHAGGGEDV